MAAAIDHSAGASVADTWFIGEDVWTPNTAGDALRSMSNPKDFGAYDYYPERYRGSDDNGGVHLNSGIVNLAFVLMVQGGQHPRGKTTFQVPAIDSNFDDSMDITSEIFYNANTQCLTAGSNFEAIRFCTAEVVSDSIYRDRINLAWKAVGVCDGCGREAIVLSDGVPMNNQEGQMGDVQQYILENVSTGAAVTCSLVGSNGDADLYVQFGSQTGPGEEFDCSSLSFTSNEECTVGPADLNTDLYVAVHAYSGYSGLQITCTGNLNPDEIMIDEIVMLTEGVLLSNQEGQTGDVQQYVLKNVSAGAAVACSLDGSNGNADLYVRIGGVTGPGKEYDCASTSLASNEKCIIGPVASSADLYIAIDAHSGYSSLDITCKCKGCSGLKLDGTIELTDGLPLNNQGGQTGDVQQYVLKDISARATVTCLLAGSNGDADLFMHFGSQTGPEEEFDCASGSPTSNEECTVGPTASSTDLYVAVHAYSGYNGLQITCTCNGCSDLNAGAIALTDGVPLDNLEGQTADVQNYVLENVSAGATVTCSLVGSSGDADLYVQFGGLTGPGEEYDCASVSETSNEECTIGPAPSTTDLYAAIYAYGLYNGLQITCSSS